MEQMTHVKSNRIEVVDALRGFAVMAILLVHNLEHFIFPVYPENSSMWLARMDSSVFHGVFALFAGKAYAIFALLFGFTFFIQSDHEKKLGRDFGYRFLWRLVLLAGFSAVNAAFFPAGDVLLLFTVVGLVLFLTRNWRTRSLLILAVFFLLQPVEWFHYIAWMLDPSYSLPDLNIGAMYAEVSEFTKAGDFWDFIICNVTLGQKASLLWAVNAGRLCQTAGLFLLGVCLGRERLFAPTEGNFRFWKNLLMAGVIATLLFAVVKAPVVQGEGVIRQTVGTALDMWHNLAFTFVLIAAFVLLYRNDKMRSWLGGLRFYGRMSLTNYISQSVIGAIIYFPFGLYLAVYCGYTVSLLVGIFTFLLQLRFCKWWLSSHRQGPLEYVWHKWTWIGTEKASAPLRKQSRIPADAE